MPLPTGISRRRIRLDAGQPGRPERELPPHPPKGLRGPPQFGAAETMGEPTVMTVSMREVCR